MLSMRSRKYPCTVGANHRGPAPATTGKTTPDQYVFILKTYLRYEYEYFKNMNGKSHRFSGNNYFRLKTELSIQGVVKNSD